MGKRVFPSIGSLAALIVAILCFLISFASLPRVLGHMRTYPAYALGELCGPVILGVPFLFLYRWCERRAAKLKGRSPQQ